MLKFFLISLIIATLSGMGIGGGGLLVIYLTLIENTPQIAAQGLNLLFFILTATASTIINARGGKILWKCTIIMSLAGLATSFFGVTLTNVLKPEILQKIFGSMLVFSGLASLFTSLKKQ